MPRLEYQNPNPGGGLEGGQLKTYRKSNASVMLLGGQDILSTGGGGEVEVPPSSPPRPVTEWVRSEIEKWGAPQHYHFREPGPHLSLGSTSPLPT